MPKDRSGSKHWNKAHTLCSARVRIQGLPDKHTFPMRNSSGSEAEASERLKIVNEVAQRMTSSVDKALAYRLLTKIAAVPLAKLDAACGAADEYIAGYRPPSTTAKLRAVGKRWTDGELRAEYGEDIELLDVRTAAHTDELLVKWVYGVVGDFPVDQIDLDASDEIKKKLAKSELAPSSQRNVLARYRALMNICVYPLKLITLSPLPAGWVPSAPKKRAFALLYSDDVSQLLGCAAISIHWRMFWAFLVLEGPRPHNATAMLIQHIDLEHDGVQFDKTKTDERIVFSLVEGSGDGIREYLRRFRPNAKQTDYLFVDDDGGPIPLPKIAAKFREHLMIAGIHHRRPELLEDNDDRRNAVAYDLKGTFITIRRAAGWKDSRIIEHTGHVDTRMLKTYHRRAKSYAQLRMQRHDLPSLIEAIPELQGSEDGDGSDPGSGQSFGHGLATRSANPATSLAVGKFSQDFVLGSEGTDMPKQSKITRLAHPSSPVQQGSAGQTTATPGGLANDDYVRRLELELMVERRVSERLAEVLARVDERMVPQMSAAVLRELQRQGIAERPKPQLVKGDEEGNDGKPED